MAPPKESKHKEQINSRTALFSFLHLIHFIFDELIKLREKKKVELDEMDGLFGSLGGYGRGTRQCSAKRKQTTTPSINSNSTKTIKESEMKTNPAVNSIIDGMKEENEIND